MSRQYSNDWFPLLISVTGMSVQAFALANGFSRNAVAEQLKRGYCAWPRRHTKSGNTSHPLYRTWAMMWVRCTNANQKAYANYGARGISVCGQWTDFNQFVRDVGERPHGMTMDRINNDGNYEPGNVRWATWSEQTKNVRQFTRGRKSK